MANITRRFIICDFGGDWECSVHLNLDAMSNSDTFKKIRKNDFKREGWHRVKGKDMCSECWEKQEANKIN